MSSVITTDQPQSRKHKLRWWTLLVLSISLVLIAVDTTILNVAIPTLQNDLNASASELQWIVSSYILVFAGALLTMGFLGDRFGRKKLLQSGIIVFSIASLSASYADSTGLLIAARALMGVGGAMIMPATLSIIVDVFPRNERAKAIGIWSAVAGVGVPLGMVIGGYRLEQYWWGSVFLINIPIGAVILAAGFALVPDSRDPKPRKLDLWGAVLSTAALSTLLYAVIEAPERGWLDTLVLAGFGSAIVMGAAFVIFELRSREPMLDIRLFKNPRLSAGSLAISISFMVMMGMLFLTTQYFQFSRFYSPLDAGVRLIPLALGFMFGGGGSAALVKGFGTKRVVFAGMVVISATLASLAFIDAQTAYWIVAAQLVGMGFGMGITMAPATEAVMGSVPDENAGVGSALNDVTRNVGGALGVGIIGSIMSSVYSSNIGGAVAGLPADAAGAAQNSIGAAAQIAANAGGETGQALITAANGAFVEGFSVAMAISAVIALGGSLFVLISMPARELNAEDTLELDQGPIELAGVAPATAPVRIDD